MHRPECVIATAQTLSKVGGRRSLCSWIYPKKNQLCRSRDAFFVEKARYRQSNGNLKTPNLQWSDRQPKLVTSQALVGFPDQSTLHQLARGSLGDEAGA